MTKKEIVFLCCAVFFCVFGFTCVSLVSNSIAQYIGRNGWKSFNHTVIPILVLLLVGAIGFVLSRFWIRIPNWKEWLFATTGGLGAAWVISRTLLLTTELIHIPQFTICTLLFSAAFPRNRAIAAGLAAVACIADEWSQSFFPNRVLDLNDIFLNFIGLYLGLIVWWAIDVTRNARRQAPITERKEQHP